MDELIFTAAITFGKYAAIPIFIILIIGGTFYLGKNIGTKETMSEAYEKGYAVQCIGSTGYYWECKK